jgi:hypothetical protein
MWETAWEKEDEGYGFRKQKIQLQVFKDATGKITNGEIIFRTNYDDPEKRPRETFQTIGIKPEEMEKLKAALGAT